jgi:hypothetical protein
MVRFGPSFKDTFFLGPRFGLALFSSMILSMTCVPGFSSDLDSTDSSYALFGHKGGHSRGAPRFC